MQSWMVTLLIIALEGPVPHIFFKVGVDIKMLKDFTSHTSDAVHKYQIISDS